MNKENVQKSKASESVTDTQRDWNCKDLTGTPFMAENWTSLWDTSFKMFPNDCESLLGFHCWD